MIYTEDLDKKLKHKHIWEFRKVFEIKDMHIIVKVLFTCDCGKIKIVQFSL